MTGIKIRNNAKKITVKSTNAKGSVLIEAANWGLWGLLFLSPFFRGLFFPQEQRVAVIAAAVIYWLAVFAEYQRKDKTFSLNILDSLVLCLPLVYLFSIPSAANYTLALDEVIENLLYFLIFWSAARLITSTHRVEKIFTVIYLSAIGVALAGLFAASGIIETNGGFLTSDGGTIASTLQYKNSLASFLTVAIFIGSFLWSKTAASVPKIILLSGNFLLLLVFFSTNSHGGYIIFALFLAVYWLLAPAAKRFALIINHLVLITSGLIGSKLFLHNIAGQNIAAAWLWPLLGICLTALGQWVSLNYLNKQKETIISIKQLLAAIVVAGLLGATTAGYLGVFQLLMAKLHMHGAMERLTMYQDGLRMVLDKPLLGWGGGGWAEAYSIYQGYGYTVRQTHSYFLQLAIETGLLGLLVAISIWSVFLYQAAVLYKSTLNNDGQRHMAAVLICSVLAIISHAVFDFDLSLAALTILMFTLMACLLSLGPQAKDGLIKVKPGRGLLVSSVGTLVIVVGTLFLISSNNLTGAAVAAIRSGDGNKALAYIEKAVAMNPLVSENYGIASQLYFALKDTEKAVLSAEKAVEMARYNPARHLELSRAYLQAGQNEKAVAAATKAVQLAPLKAEYYQGLSDVLISSAINELKEKNIQTAAKYFNQALTIPDEMNKVLNSVHPAKKKLWQDIGAAPLTVTDKTKLNLGIAQLYSGDLAQASQFINDAAKNPQLQKETLVWQAILARHQGDETKVQAILQGAEKDNPQIKQQFDTLSILINKPAGGVSVAR